ncbi:hypothetical protein L208DRAFT_1246132 [Tricholoma matsutake]|nr:hypothetical protein L208DRAFT_1246132 [Tricholoma matsutake 945]
MYKISRSLSGREHVASIIPVSDIPQSIHLIPKCGLIIPHEWTSATVLDDSNFFFVSPFLDRHTYLTVH